MNPQVLLAVLLALLAAGPTLGTNAAEVSQVGGDSAHRSTLYVSKLGDDSDGSSWGKAFRTIQKALDTVPNARGGHRILVRPDT